VVMPGHDIFKHHDEQPANWVTRVHVPLMTNELSYTLADGVQHHMSVGYAYSFDTRVEHFTMNGGHTPRVHFLFDVRR
jgi:Aspartyl/Asparaginyl beta-hydroxylase